MSRWLCRCVMPFVLPFAIVAGQASLSAGPQEDADKILDASGFHGGFVVHVAPASLDLSQALRANDATQVHVLLAEGDDISAARETLRDGGNYGEIAVDRLSGTQLPYVDNLVNLLVLEERQQISDDELLRVLVPNGVAMIRESSGHWRQIVKPRPDNIDEWSHYLHDPSGNAVAHDDVVGPPRHLQWVGSPRWSRHHDRMASMSALVSSGGRMFYIMDEGSRISIQLPPDWKLIARATGRRYRALSPLFGRR